MPLFPDPWQRRSLFEFPGSTVAGPRQFLTSIIGSLQSWNSRVRPCLVLRNRNPLASWVVHRVSGHLSSCIWNLWLYLEDVTGGVGNPSWCDFILRVIYKEVPRHQDLRWVDGEIGVFQNVAVPMMLPLEFRCETSIFLRCDGKVGIPFQTKQGNRTSCRDQEGRRGSD